MGQRYKRWLNWRSLLWPLFLLLVLQWLEYRGVLSSWNSHFFDALMAGRSIKTDNVYSDEIFTVGIDDKAYDECFHSGSPLNPQGVSNLIKTIASLQPAIMGVDIRTEGSEYKGELDQLSTLSPQIVWISAFEKYRTIAPSFGTWLLDSEDETTVKPLPVLGTPPDALPNLRQTNWAVPIYPRDEDAAVRRLPRSVGLSFSESFTEPKLPALWRRQSEAQEFPTFARKIADLRYPKHTRDSAPELYISYGGLMPRQFNVSDLLTCSVPGEFKTNGHSWPTFALLMNEYHGKAIVLVGGTFRESRDFYTTPVGELPGLVVNAYAVRAELEGGFVGVSQPWAWMLDLAIALFLLYLCNKGTILRLFGPGSKFAFLDRLTLTRGVQRKGLLLGVGVVGAVCLVSWYSADGRYFVSFAGEAFGVLLDRLHDLWRLTRDDAESLDV